MAARAAAIAHMHKKKVHHHDAGKSDFLAAFEEETVAIGLGQEPAKKLNVDQHRPFLEPDYVFKDRYERVAYWACVLVEKYWFDPFIIFCILIVAVNTGLGLEYEDKTLLSILEVLSTLTGIVFTAECIVKIVAEGHEWWNYFNGAEGSFNTFDFTVVLAGYVMDAMGQSGGTVAVMRLLRLLKIMSKIEALRMILMGLASGLKSVVNIMLLLMLIIYIFAIVGCLVFGTNDPVHFGSVGIAMLTLFRVATLCGWSQVHYINFYGCEQFDAGMYMRATLPELEAVGLSAVLETKAGDFADFYCLNPEGHPVISFAFFFMYTLMTAWVVLSLFIGVITGGMFEVLEMMEAEAEAEAAKHREETLRVAHAKIRDAISLSDSKLNTSLDKAFGRPSSEMMIHPYVWLSKKAHVLANHRYFTGFIVFCIMIVSVTVGMQTDGVGDPTVMLVLDNAILAVFTFESAVKIVAEGKEPVNFFKDSWNLFDFVIVAMSYVAMAIPAIPSSVVRLMRLLRVLKLAKTVPALRAVVESLMAALGSVGYVMIMILVVNYIFAVLGMVLFRTNDRTHWGSLLSAMFTVWQVETLDSWDEVLYINMYGCDKYGYYNLAGEPVQARACKEDDIIAYGWIATGYFVVLVILGGLVLPTVLIGVVSIAFEQSTKEILVEMNEGSVVDMIAATAKSWFPNFLTDKELNQFNEVYNALNTDGDGGLDRDEIQPFLDHLVKEYLDNGISPKQMDEMFEIVDADGSGEINFSEFLWFLLSIKKEVWRKKGVPPSPSKALKAPMEFPGEDGIGDIDTDLGMPEAPTPTGSRDGMRRRTPTGSRERQRSPHRPEGVADALSRDSAARAATPDSKMEGLERFTQEKLLRSRIANIEKTTATLEAQLDSKHDEMDTLWEQLHDIEEAKEAEAAARAAAPKVPSAKGDGSWAVPPGDMKSQLAFVDARWNDLERELGEVHSELEKMGDSPGMIAGPGSSNYVHPPSPAVANLGAAPPPKHGGKKAYQVAPMPLGMRHELLVQEKAAAGAF